MIILLILTVTSHDVHASGLKPPDVEQEIAALKLQLREETLDLREEMYDLLGDSQSNLSWLVKELVREVRGYKELVAEQGKVVDELKIGLTTALGELGKVRNNLDAVRSEVRLISQHKLTWQNSTSAYRTTDFLVDGVYTRSFDETINPIQHNANVVPGQIVMVDLGGIFKVHTVKIWSRLACCKERAAGLLVYADEQFVGVTTGTHDMHNIRVTGEVYARKIIIKQPATTHINLREVQVYGNGPYSEQELV